MFFLFFQYEVIFQSIFFDDPRIYYLTLFYHFSLICSSFLLFLIFLFPAEDKQFFILLYFYLTTSHRKGSYSHYEISLPQNLELQKSVSIVMKAVPGKTTMPILECILIDASTNDIKFTSNDMELGIETRVQGLVLEKGINCFGCKNLSEICP